MGFCKLDQNILFSSVWCESLETKVLWITMLAAADAEGIVRAAAPGLAKLAGLPLEETLKALEVLLSPDPYSKSPEHEGRRIERTGEGFLILNFKRYRTKDYSMSPEAIRKREWREKARGAGRDIRRDNVPPLSGQSVYASASASESASSPGEKENPKKSLTRGGKRKRAELDQLAGHVLAVLKIPMTDRGETEKLLRAFGLEYMKAAVDRMAAYFEAVRENGWTKYIIGRHWRNLYEKLEYFSSDDNLQRKLRDMGASGEKKSKPDYSTWATLGAHDPEREAEVEAAAARELEAEPEPEPKTDQQRLDDLRRGRDGLQPWDARRGSFDREIERLTKQIAEGA